MTSAFQLKYVESLDSLRGAIFKAKGQIKQAPAKKKWVEVNVHSGVKADFLSKQHKDGKLLPDSISAFWPGEIGLRIIFSDGQRWVDKCIGI